jgi:hypothetical protein
MGTSFMDPAARTCANCTQVYEYDYAADELSCASCNPSGAPTGKANARIGSGYISNTANINDTDGSMSRGVLDDGSVFFESRDRLLPEDSNDKQDVYRWSHGQLDLVSTGRSASDSYYGDSSPDGRSVFFFTSERLVSQDVDGVADVYVKHEGGGLPAQNPPAEPPCFGEGCLNKSPDPPGGVSPASNGFSGPANAKPARQKTRKCAKARHGKAKSAKAKASCKKRSTHDKAKGGSK